MKDLDKMRRAQIQLSKLAQGIDPFTSRDLPEDSVLNNVNLARSFFLAADVLGQVIQSGGIIGNRPDLSLEPFAISEEDKKQIVVFDTPVSVRHIAENISVSVDPSRMRKLPATAITDWLAEKGYLRYVFETKRFVTTDTSAEVGIETEMRDTVVGDYTAVIYTQQAQRFIIDHLDEIVAMLNKN